MHRIVLTVCLSIGLHGCAISPSVIKSDTLAMGEVIDDTTNKLLVMNLLRARDKAPLHFADIPLMRESLQQSFSLSWLDLIGTSRAPASARDALSFGTTVQKTPSFDLNHLHSKDFITGISSPIDPKIVKYWLDRGLDRRLDLLLFFSGVEIIEVTHSEKGPVTTIKISNSPRDGALMTPVLVFLFGVAPQTAMARTCCSPRSRRPSAPGYMAPAARSTGSCCADWRWAASRPQR